MCSCPVPCENHTSYHIWCALGENTDIDPLVFIPQRSSQNLWERTFWTDRKDYENHLLQSRLHFRIHSALQEIKHRRKQAKEAAKMEKKQSKRSKNGVTNNNSSIDEDSISISLGGSESLSRQDSNSSFETAPEYSSEDERDLGDMERDSSPKENVVLETTVWKFSVSLSNLNFL